MVACGKVGFWVCVLSSASPRLIPIRMYREFLISYVLRMSFVMDVLRGLIFMIGELEYRGSIEDVIVSFTPGVRGGTVIRAAVLHSGGGLAWIRDFVGAYN